jgi:predicted nucleic acid-binding protein
VSRRYLIDNSAWARVATETRVRETVEYLIRASQPDDILVCPPIALEYGHSARGPREHGVIVEQLAAFTECAKVPPLADVLSLQAALWAAGLVRAVGAADLLIAAYALANDATVIHYDSDFEHVAAVTPGFSHEWVVPRGSV